MYLDFIKDLVKIGDSIILCCKDGTYEGFIVKINNDIIAIRQSDDSILLKEDKDITDIKVKSCQYYMTKISITNKNSPTIIHLSIFDRKEALWNPFASTNT